MSPRSTPLQSPRKHFHFPRWGRRSQKFTEPWTPPRRAFFSDWSLWRIRWITPCIFVTLIVSTAAIIWLIGYTFTVTARDYNIDRVHRILLSDLTTRVDLFMEQGVTFHSVASEAVVGLTHLRNRTLVLTEDCPRLVLLWICILADHPGMELMTFLQQDTGALCRLTKFNSTDYRMYVTPNTEEIEWSVTRVNPERFSIGEFIRMRSPDEFQPVSESDWVKLARNLPEGEVSLLTYSSANYAPEPSQSIASSVYIDGVRQGSVQTVWGTNAVTTFLQDTLIDPHGRNFLLELNGRLYDASHGRTIDENMNPIQWDDPRVDAVVRTAVGTILKENPNFYAITEDTMLSFDFAYDGTAYWVHVTKAFYVNYHFDLIVGTVTRKNFLFTPISRSIWISVAVSACITFFAILLSCCITTCISVPLKRSTREMKSIGRFQNLNVISTSTPFLYELQLMNEAVNSMKRGINNFKLYVPNFVVDVILRDENKSRLGLKARRLSVSFTDIANFSSISQQMNAEVLVRLMNEFFSEASQSVKDYGGWINVYLGDALFCVYGLSDKSRLTHESSAVEASLDMERRMELQWGRWNQMGFPPITLFHGINSGRMWYGNIGNTEFRMQWTCLADAVNTAQRIQQLGKFLCAPTSSILIGEQTFTMVGHLFYCQWVGQYQLRGRMQRTNVYHVISGIILHGTSTFWSGAIDRSRRMKEAYESGDVEEMLFLCDTFKHFYSVHPQLMKSVTFMRKECLKILRTDGEYKITGKTRQFRSEISPKPSNLYRRTQKLHTKPTNKVTAATSSTQQQVPPEDTSL
mmetsp:Transcript_9134/g.33713  ORF Transcript_9134/g.33713 Transcript_9134/m.33713 type:complete len:805 (-) Transcript_9134:1974-4388(-)